MGKEISALIRKLSSGQSGIHPEIWARWGDIVGEDLAKRTFPRSLRAGTLLVAVGSSTWMQELTYLKGKIMDNLAEEVGPDVVKEIRLILDANLFKPRFDKRDVPRVDVDHSKPLPDEIESAVAAIKDEGLRNAVRRAARANVDD